MQRRDFIRLLGGGAAAAWPRAAHAKNAAGIARIGLLVHAPPPPTPADDVFPQGLRDLGWIEYVPAQAADVTWKSAVRCRYFTAIASAAAGAGRHQSIPIASATGDPVGRGFVASPLLARREPGGYLLRRRPGNHGQATATDC
jgi:hypothetical protein